MSSEQEPKHTRTCTPLHTAAFVESLERFIDENKPDNLVLKQLQSLALEWTDCEDCEDCEESTSATANDYAIPTQSSEGNDIAESASSSSRSGILQIVGEYISLSLYAKCKWSRIKDKCEMHFELYALASFITTVTPVTTARTPNVNSNVNSNVNVNVNSNVNVKGKGKHDQKQNANRRQDKLRTSVIDRMRSDPYIRRILLMMPAADHQAHAHAHANAHANAQKKVLLCDASIKFELARESTKHDIHSQSMSMPMPMPMNQLEERVYVSEDALEAIRRALFSQMDSMDGNILLMEFLLDMPYLPRRRSAHMASNSSEHAERIVESMLAGRIVLRVLEDVMLDACEKAGEDELLDDLNISNSPAGDDDSSGEDEAEKVNNHNNHVGGHGRNHISGKRRKA